MTVDLPPLEHDEVTTDGVALHVVKAGPSGGPPVVLLHGFPEFWYGWRHQIPALVEAGYRVWVPDQRGYNRSDKPDGVEAYAIDRLARDALGVIDATGRERVRVVGHDWGAGVAWYLLLTHPERIAQGVTINVPHPAVFDSFLPGRPSQLLKSWYMFVFQLSGLAERAFSFGEWRLLERVFLDTANRPEAFTDADMARYREAWRRPGALTGMMNWYRALFRADPDDPPRMTVDPETLVLWGVNDPYLHRAMAPASAEYLADGRLEEIDDATHWVQHERPDLVNEYLREFFAGASQP